MALRIRERRMVLLRRLILKQKSVRIRDRLAQYEQFPADALLADVDRVFDCLRNADVLLIGLRRLLRRSFYRRIGSIREVASLILDIQDSCRPIIKTLSIAMDRDLPYRPHLPAGVPIWGLPAPFELIPEYLLADDLVGPQTDEVGAQVQVAKDDGGGDKYGEPHTRVQVPENKKAADQGYDKEKLNEKLPSGVPVIQDGDMTNAEACKDDPLGVETSLASLGNEKKETSDLPSILDNPGPGYQHGKLTSYDCEILKPKNLGDQLINDTNALLNEHGLSDPPKAGTDSGLYDEAAAKKKETSTLPCTVADPEVDNADECVTVHELATQI